MTSRMTKIEAIKYGLRWKDAICDRGDTELSDAIQFLNMAIEALTKEPICCKDCKNWHSTGGTDKERKGWCSVWKSWNYSKADDYCSFAERLESDE